MKTVCLKLLFAVTLCHSPLLSPLAFAQKVTTEPAVSRQIDAVFREFFPADQPGGAVLVVRNGKTILRKGYGLADVAKKTPTSPDNIYKIGSITKQFTATAILLLEEEGKLKVTDAVDKYLPGYPKGDKITIEQLLTHTSGIKNYTAIGAWHQGMHAPMTLAKMMDVFKDEPMDFEPGTGHGYSNSGYVLLGAIIEKASGMKYGDFIEKRVFAKAGLRNSFYGRDNVALKNAVTGYRIDGKNYVPALPISMTQPYAAGALLSSVDDLYKWSQAVLSGKVLSQKSRDKAFANHRLASGAPVNYGYGWVPDSLMGMKTIGHGGGINGFRSMAIMAPDKNTFVVVLTNNETLTPEFEATKALALATGAYQEEPAILLSASELEKYVGVYPVNESAGRTVYVDAGKLYSRRTNSPPLELVNVAKDQFVYKGSFSKATFKVEGGKAVGMHFGKIGARTAYFAKSDKPVPAAKKAIALTEAQLKRLEGKYAVAPNFDMHIKLVDGKMQAQATGQQAVEIFPSSAHRFFLKVADAEIEFQSGTDGNVTGLVLYQDGEKMPGKKVAD
ncbi:serine hydrolase [Hymenobacter rubripertinctus]|uniref:DUF3471 domain-containing protein n=1 Tax=Hymenobacter rubripertinctus TaxID=2029981 RepID=A0A418QVX0_9BACT|nr:serine hydrolase [Hymenobacter rubripertinctus]RIY09303.1 DUF3471 domain-containing protein [Hymenobacter rubripertinctus]